MFIGRKKIEAVKAKPDGTINLNEYKLSRSIDKNVEIMKQIFQDDQTLITRQFENQYESRIKCCAFYINGMINNEIINEDIIKPIMLNNLLIKKSNTLDIIESQVLFSNEVKKSDDLNEIVESVLYGDTALFVNGSKNALIINSKGWQVRAVAEPDTEKVLRGPREGFTESILTNISLIRRKLKTSDFKVKLINIGTRTNTKTCICYLDSLVDKKILDELYSRLNKINIDGVLDSNYISELIKDAPYSPFKTIGITERPDTAAGKLLEGRIAIIVDGSPIILTVPYLFIENFQSSDDYYLNYYFASIGRILRIIGFIVSTSVPAIYIALTTFHREMIPTPLVLSMAQARQGIPFPTVIECVLMLLVFEIIRETGIRMPSNIGQALSVVGALVIGQAAVEAKLISAPMVIIVAITAITGLINPRIKGVTIIVRFIFLILSSILGFYGYIFAIIGLLIHILGLRSFGIEYTSQISSYRLQEIKDNFVRSPWWFMKTRPNYMAADITRIKEDGDKK